MVFLLAPAAACLMGIARGAMDTFVDFVSGRGTNSSPIPLRDRPAVQAAVGQAEAAIGSARAYLFNAVGNVWNAACNGEADPGRKIAKARLAITNAYRESARAVDVLFEASGTTAVYRSHPIERYHRDISVLAKHWGGQTANIDMAGQVMLGLKPAGPGW
jgi:alkylation response protein AidB-like acyl-CoA dehydrogenase